MKRREAAPGRVQTGIRLEKRLVKTLKAVAELHDVSLGELVEGFVYPSTALSPVNHRSRYPPWPRYATSWGSTAWPRTRRATKPWTATTC